ncbi:TAXI family TRAP transporter solute-binding subunit [Nocardiopsis ganjiahuensis]|uniref:TAXI family TRAP transporter solute-binding subunit n=1 Tax=Nocardiopsis ganjiahuensis TaxID=239984 RepID=UPI00034DAD5E|nr:TAXI family TRAP transporter solute-binding subunit [Nocardiopsis ganjiahuensis]
MRKPAARARRSAAAAVLTAVLAATGCTAADELDEEGRLRQIVWTTYGTGTSTYADVAAVADAITTHEGTPVRVITSDTGIGRLAPLREGPAHFSRTGDEYIYAFEGEEDFTSELWGPQDVRVVWAPVAPHGLLVPDDSGIETYEDLRGSDFPYITANPSVNNKLGAFLAYGGLTWDDVNPVEVGYGEQPGAMQSGRLDVLFHQVHGSSLYELEAAFPIRWLSMDDPSPEAAQRVTDLAPAVEIGEFTGAPGQDEGQSDRGMLYTLPVVTYADTDPEIVYDMVRSLVDQFEHYEDSTATLPSWSEDAVLAAPKQVPFHEGLIRFLEEEGAWPEDAARLNGELLERGETLRELWPRAVESDDRAATWNELKADVPVPDPLLSDASQDGPGSEDETPESEGR